MPTGSTTGTTNSVASTNPTLTNLFTQMFGGANGAGATGVGSLSSIASGGNITSLNQALTANNATAFAGNVGQIKEAFGSSGMGSSSSMGKVLAQAAVQNTNQLTQNIASSDLTAQGQQLSAASYLSQIFSGAANQYFTNQSTSSKSDSGLSTFLNIFSTLFPKGV